MDAADLGHHISRSFNGALERVRTRVLLMGGLVEQQVQKALTALAAGDARLGEAVALEDCEVNDLEVAIDEECAGLLARRAPTAGDLRVIVAMMKIITDLERIGDEAEKVGSIASRLASAERPADGYSEVRHLGRVACGMVHDALDAFARLDASAALAVARRDRSLDEEYEAIQRKCVADMMENPRVIRRVLDLLWIVRSIERIGDHAKNISEYVIYMVSGKDVRHRAWDDAQWQVAPMPARELTQAPPGQVRCRTDVSSCHRTTCASDGDA